MTFFNVSSRWRYGQKTQKQKPLKTTLSKKKKKKNRKVVLINFLKRKLVVLRCVHRVRVIVWIQDILGTFVGVGGTLHRKLGDQNEFIEWNSYFFVLGSFTFTGRCLYFDQEPFKGVFSLQGLHVGSPVNIGCFHKWNRVCNNGVCHKIP